jgi:transposase
MDKQQETKLSLAEEISSDLLLELFEEGLNKHELIFIDYALYDNRHKKKYPERILEPSIIKELYNIVENSPHIR